MMMFWISLLLLCLQGRASQEHLLNDDEVWMIVMNTPDAIHLEGRGGCPSVEVIHSSATLTDAQLRNSCTASGSGLVNNYTVDRRSGIIWTGMDVRKYIDSERL